METIKGYKAFGPGMVSKQVDGEEIKEDTFYRLVNGKFEEANED